MLQCFLLMVFYGKIFNVKLCTLCLYSGFIHSPVQNYIINKESRLRFTTLLLDAICVNTAGGQWSKAGFCDVTWPRSTVFRSHALLSLSLSPCLWCACAAASRRRSRRWTSSTPASRSGSWSPRWDWSTRRRWPCSELPGCRWGMKKTWGACGFHTVIRIWQQTCDHFIFSSSARLMKSCLVVLWKRRY